MTWKSSDIFLFGFMTNYLFFLTLTKPIAIHFQLTIAQTNCLTAQILIHSNKLISALHLSTSNKLDTLRCNRSEFRKRSLL